MKLLKTITHPDFPTPGVETHTREAARVVLVNEENMALLIFSAKMGIYKIVGGEMIAGEDILSAAKREAGLETGCETEILGEIGEVIEERPSDNESGRGNIQQSSYCYHGKVVGDGKLQMSEAKKDRGFEFVWIKVSDVINLMKRSKAKSKKAELVKNRDIIIFEEYLKLTNN